MTTVSVLVPVAIATANILSSSVAEPLAADFVLNSVTYALAESAWAASTSYQVGDRKYRATTHKRYECVLATGTTRTLPPESDGKYWEEIGPTQQFAPFDTVTNTKVYGNGSLTYSVQVGFCNAICFYGLDGATLNVKGYTDTVANGGVLFYDSGNITIQQTPTDEYDYLFGQIVPLDKYVISGLLPYPNARFDISITASAGVLVQAGTIAFGDLMSLTPSYPDWAGPQTGSSAEPLSYSYIKINDDGTAKITRRFGSTNLHVDLQIPLDAADISLVIVQRVLDVPACWIATDLPNYGGLNTFGLATGKLSYDEAFARWSIDVKGLS